jgi:hypothetical protein
MYFLLFLPLCSAISSSKILASITEVPCIRQQGAQKRQVSRINTALQRQHPAQQLQQQQQQTALKSHAGCLAPE